MVKFPEERNLRYWIRAVENTQTSLTKYLPHIDEDWYREMMSCVEITQIIPECREILPKAAAKLFYKITKNHHRIDGNKRSALLVTFLLFIHNSYFIDIPPVEMYDLAERVAKGLDKQEDVESALAESFGSQMTLLS